MPYDIFMAVYICGWVQTKVPFGYEEFLPGPGVHWG